jgi:hypothetical protein
MSANTLLISVAMLKERAHLHGNTDEKLVFPDIKINQDMYIHPILGTALYTKLQTLIAAGTINDAGNIDYKNLLDLYIVDALIYYTLKDLATSLSFQLWNKGVVRKQGENTELPSMSEIVDIANGYKNKAEWYAHRLKMYLREHANVKYPEYLNPGNTADTINPENKSFTSPIYLGDYDDPYCNKGGFNGKPYSG